MNYCNSHVKHLKASLLGDLAAGELNPGKGRILSVFDHVCNIRTGVQSGFSLGDGYIPMAPYHIRVGGDTIIKDLGFKQGMEVRITADGILIPQRQIIIHFDQAGVWNSSLPALRSEGPEGDNLDHRMEVLYEYLTKHGQNEGLGGLNQHWAALFTGAIIDTGNYLLKSGYTHIKQLVERRRVTEDMLRGLVGLGPGLTPAGDDFLVGWLSAEFWNYFSSLPPESDNSRGCKAQGTYLHSLISGLEAIDLFTATTFVSAMQLKGAMKGNFNACLLNFYSFLKSPFEQFLSAVDDLITLGSTSGTDILTGVVFGFLKNCRKYTIK